MSDKRPATGAAEHLIEEALTRLRLDGDAEGALWRLVDAAGLLKRDCFINPLCIGTKSCPTGRGYFLGESKNE